jgi:type VI secretion system ImpM family protein
MTTEPAPEPEIGWFGKIPSLGDFAGRGLPRSFVSVWEQWLSAELYQARTLWADAWPSTYRAAPPLCFSVSGGVVDEHAWHGLLVPSVDRVEREFPLTLAQRRAPHIGAPLQRSWWTALAVAGRQSQARTGGVEGMAAALRSVMACAPDGEAPRPTPLADGSSAWWVLPAAGSGAGDAAPSLSTGLPRGPAFRHLLGGR